MNAAVPIDVPLDRIVVIGGSAQTLDMLRLATVRSDDVLLVAEGIDAATRRFIDHFAIDFRQGPADESDLHGATAVVVTLGDVERENAMVLDARRHGIPVHVDGRPLVSDFTMLGLIERHASSFARRRTAA